MNRKLYALSMLIGCAFTVTVVATQTSQIEEDVFCGAQQTVEFDVSKPISHPDNHCATKQQSDVSWASWLSGRSNNNQFHYLDLLELLSRFSDESSQPSYSGQRN